MTVVLLDSARIGLACVGSPELQFSWNGLVYAQPVHHSLSRDWEFSVSDENQTFLHSGTITCETHGSKRVKH